MGFCSVLLPQTSQIIITSWFSEIYDHANIVIHFMDVDFSIKKFHFHNLFAVQRDHFKLWTSNVQGQAEAPDSLAVTHSVSLKIQVGSTYFFLLSRREWEGETDSLHETNTMFCLTSNLEQIWTNGSTSKR